MIHQNKVRNYKGSMAQLAEDIGDLKYDALADFLQLLATKIGKDADKDQERERIKLASSLYNCSSKLEDCTKDIEKAWKISEPFMK